MPIFPSAEALLAELEPLPSGQRFGTAIRHALALAPADRDRLLAELSHPEEGAGIYRRELVAAMAAATGVGPYIAAALRDSAPRVRSRVLRAALGRPGLVDPAELVAVVTDGPRDFRLALYRGLRRRPDTAVRADDLIGPVRERWGDAEAARLLPACGTATVRALLPELAYAVSNWSAVGHRHADVVREHVAAGLAAASDAARPSWWSRHVGPVTALAEFAPGDLLALCERWLVGLMPGGVLAGLGRLLAHDAARTVRLLLADTGRARQVADTWPSRRDIARLLALPDAQLGPLLRVTARSRRFLPRVLRHAPPARREALFDAANAGRDLATELVSDELLPVLPHDRRHAEARRMLALPAVRHDERQVVRYSRYLPYAEALAVLAPVTRNTDPEERAEAYVALIGAAAGSRDRAAVTDLFNHLGRLRNEQDPVRMPALSALAGVHPGLFDPAVRDGLDRLVRDAMDARDRSYGTRNAVQQLIFRVLTAGAPSLITWALDAVERLTLWTYAATSASGWQQLRRGSEHEVFARIRPWLVAAVERGQPEAVFGVVRALGRRAWPVTGLQDLLATATRTADDSTIRPAVELWLEPPATRTERAVDLVRHDGSYITLWPVLRTIARHRPDLVDALILAGGPLRGRFDTGDARWIPEIEPAVVAGWTPARVRRYAGLLRRGVDDQGLEVWSRARLARLLATVAGPTAVADLIAPPEAPAAENAPAAPQAENAPEALVPENAPEAGNAPADPVTSPEVPVVESALAGLGSYAEPVEALPVLLGSADGDRARVAIFAAGRCVRQIRPSETTAALTAALDARRVTVRKEAARLLAVARPAGAVDVLLAMWRREDLHRDVRIAVATALREWPADPRVWAVLEEAATGGERGLALDLASVGPHALPVAHRPRFAAVVRGLVRHPEPAVVRAAHTALRVWTRYDPGGADDLAAAVTDLTPGTEWTDALASLTDAGVWGAVPGLLPRVVADLVRASTVDADAEPTRDLPARQRARRLVQNLRRSDNALRRNRDETLRTVGVLRADPSFTPEAATLAAALAWPGPGLADDLATVADLLAGLPATTGAVVATIPVQRWPGLDPDSLAHAASALGGRTDVPAGLLAVAVVAAVGAEAGWPAEWRDHLRALRRHPEAEVRHAALRPVTYVES